MAARRQTRNNSVEEEDAELPEEASKTTGRSTRKRTVKDMAESEEDPEKQRLQKAHSKHYIVIMFFDQRCMMLNMAGQKAGQKWKLDNRAVYGENLQVGDFIIVQHPFNMDQLQQWSRAGIRMVTSVRKSADGLVKQLEERAIGRSRKKACERLSPSHQEKEQSFVNGLFADLDGPKSTADREASPENYLPEESQQLDLPMTQDNDSSLGEENSAIARQSIPDQPIIPTPLSSCSTGQGRDRHREASPASRFTSNGGQWKFDPFTGRRLTGTDPHYPHDVFVNGSPSRLSRHQKNHRVPGLTGARTPKTTDEWRARIVMIDQRKTGIPFWKSREVWPCAMNLVADLLPDPAIRSNADVRARESSGAMKMMKKLKVIGSLQYMFQCQENTHMFTRIEPSVPKARVPEAVERNWCLQVLQGYCSGLTPLQKNLLQRVKNSMENPGYGKEEMYPGSLRWVLTARFSVFKKQLRSNLMLDAVDLALLLFGSHNTAMAICTGRNFGLQAALGRDTVIDITGWINTYHPHCVKNPAVHISVEDLLGAFSKRLTYYRKASSTSDYDRYGAGASTSKARDSPVPYIDEEEGHL
ncbi:hypothetical protein RvY_00490 [Ramazzottius varieornatus]|uniref:Uncharacterized protein n=1 Tax=Ramazzottius varieornatus TaxID=947166 RepID=A0A1D1UDE5_RAMVA|nr:hypothetical protein RvY_00490 [Ramazzottius varieornatus]